MSKIIGTYTQEKTENLEQYYGAIGVPYVARKMMSLTSPKLSIENEGDEWTITTSTLLRTITMKFKLGEEYEESMPKGNLQSTTTMENDCLKTVSIGPNDTKILRTYEPTENGCVLTLRHEASGTTAKRFFVRA